MASETVTSMEFVETALESDTWQAIARPLEHIHNLAAICDGNKIVFMNGHGLSMLGYDKLVDVIGQDITTLFHNDFLEIAALGLEVFAEDDQIISLKLVGREGKVVEAEMWVTALMSDEGREFLIEARDITGHLKAARALRSREARLQEILNTVADGIITLDQEGRIESFNPAAEAIFGFSRQEALGKNIRTLMIPPKKNEVDVEKNDDKCLQNGLEALIAEQCEAMGRRKDGHEFPVEVSFREASHDGKKAFTSVVRDITLRKQQEQRIFHMAHHDSLTDLPNRLLLEDRLDEALKRAQRHGYMLALAYIDLNDFKPVNDTHGHAAGDEVLKATAQRIPKCLRKTDTVARVGGDEFVAVLEELHSHNDLYAIAENLLRVLREPIVIDKNKSVSISGSIGIAVYPDDAKEIEALMHCADEAMYAVKEAGKDRYVLFSDKDNLTKR